MEVKGIVVNHKTFGIGTVIEYMDRYITVEFVCKKVKFIYPDIFKTLLKAEDDAIQSTIILEIEAAKVEAEEKKKIEESIKSTTDERQNEEPSIQKTTVDKDMTHKSKLDEKTRRIAGRRMTFFVFQGNTFDKEYRGGYIWAPVTNKNGNRFHHWDRLLDVQEGDIILHGCNGYIRAVSVAKAVCYECVQPPELTVEDLWDIDGRRIDCDYIYIEKPIKTSAFIDDIIRLCNVKYAPFDKTGNGNMGYLFEINKELALIFLNASIGQNSYLDTELYIKELISEINNY